eukprot:350371-Chlamydomonas_euryale.AAC.7
MRLAWGRHAAGEGPKWGDLAWRYAGLISSWPRGPVSRPGTLTKRQTILQGERGGRAGLPG